MSDAAKNRVEYLEQIIKKQERIIDLISMKVESNAFKKSVTPRQLAILQMLSMGMSGIEMAERLGLTKNTIKSHIRGLYKNLGARTSGHAVALGIRYGLILKIPERLESGDVMTFPGKLVSSYIQD